VKQIRVTEVQFPDVKLTKNKSSKLRGYIANTFGNISNYFHNHDGDKLIYKYPIIQYKILNSTPTLIGIDEGSQLLNTISLNIHTLNLDTNIDVNSKTIKTNIYDVGVSDDLYKYKISDWVALNDKNYKIYSSLTSDSDRKSMLKRILIGNVLSFFKSISYTELSNILVNIENIKPKSIKIKDSYTIAFNAFFTTNMQLPNHIGLGRNTSKGFGVISKL